MPKLTLSVAKSVVSRAKRYAKQQGISISEMVEAYLAAVVAPLLNRGPRESPILHSLRGSLKKANIEEYRSHLVSKYQ